MIYLGVKCFPAGSLAMRLQHLAVRSPAFQQRHCLPLAKKEEAIMN